jgi:hypothetical protein
MGENTIRTGTKFYDRRRGWLGALLGVGAATVALLMMLTPAAAATSANLTLHSPWKGAVTPSSSGYITGCANVKVIPWKFHLKTGIGGGGSLGNVHSCKKAAGSLGLTSSADVYGGVTVSIPIKAHAITSTTTSVSMNAMFTAAVALKATDGVASNTAAPPPCTAASSSYHDMDAYYEWNYNASYGYFYDYNDSYAYWDNYSTGSYHYGYAYGTGPTPSPFNLNNTSYEDLYNYWGADSYCTASANYYVDQQANLVDTTTGFYQTETNSTYPNYMDVNIETYSQIDWSCGYDFYWYGPSNYTYGNTTVTCTSYNATLVSYVDVYSYSYIPPYTSTSSYTTGTNNTQVWSSTGTTHETAYWNDTFNGTHKYELLLYIEVGAGASDSWKKGIGSWNVNAASGGNGFKLTTVVIT